jgi:tRNA(Ile)-lysidine synthase TilS/MesJ
MAKRELLRHQEIERSILTKYRGKLWGPFVRAIKEYALVKPNDKICVCISGGKDSSLLAKLFEELQKHSDFPFEVKYLVMNPGYIESVQKIIYNNLDVLNIKAHIEETDIFEIANAQKNGGCYLCAKMRRGALYRIAKEMGCNKIALGHHYDDVIQTILMNMLNAGSFQTMMPKLHSDNYPGMELIRPLYLIREKDIIAWAKYNGLEFIRCACKFDNADLETNVRQRVKTKMLIEELRKNYNENVEKNIFAAGANVNLDKVIAYKTDKKLHSFLDTYDNED